MISPSVTISRFSLGISRPTTDLPGMISTTRTLMADRARARSFDRLLIWLTLTPGAGRNSNRVITGPGSTATTSASTPKSRSLSSTKRDIASSASSEYDCSRGPASSSKDNAGSSLDLGASNNGTCRSRSTRSLFCGTGAAASIRGGGRFACFLVSSRTTSWRSCLRCWPEASSRRCSIRVRTQSIALRTDAPS